MITMAFFNKKGNKVKFYGFIEHRKELNNKSEYIVTKRLMELIGLTAILVLILIFRLGYIQMTQSEKLAVKLDTYGSKTYYTDAPRGEIYDRNYTKLVENQNVICVNYFAPQSISEKEITRIAKFLSQNITIDFSKNNINNITTRNIKEFFIMANEDIADSLISDEEDKELKEEYTDSSSYEKAKLNLQLEKIPDDLSLVYQYMTQDEIEQTRFEYLIQNCKSGMTTLVEGISVEEASIIGENTNILKGIEISTGWSRNSLTNGNMTTVLGKLTTKKQGLPSESKAELLAKGYSNDSRVGTTGLEQQYESILRGYDTAYSIKYDSDGIPQILKSENGTKGDNIRISIDWELQQFADSLIENELKACNSSNAIFDKMYFAMIDPSNGEVLVMSCKGINKSTGEVYDAAQGVYMDAVKIGSTSKAGTLYTAFKENIIVPNTYMMDEPIKIAGTPEKKSYKNMGNINEVDAMALSSNVYMFRIAMKMAGAEYRYNESLNVDFEAFVKTISTIRRDFGELGLGTKTGIDLPNEGDGYKGNRTEAGLLLDACIGQYDTYTPIQLLQYTATLANNGIKVQPHLLIESFKNDSEGNHVTTSSFKTNIQDDVSDQATAFERIKLGMRACVTRTDGTSHTYWSEKPYAAYCKTGTAEDYTGIGNGKTDYPNHLQIGYISATENSEPIVAFVSITYRQTVSSTGGESSAPLIANQVVDKYVEKYGLN